jgi:hypothetical protein
VSVQYSCVLHVNPDRGPSLRPLFDQVFLWDTRSQSSTLLKNVLLVGAS